MMMEPGGIGILRSVFPSPSALTGCGSIQGLTVVAISTTALRSQHSCWVWRFQTINLRHEEQQSLSELSMTDARHDFSQ